MARFRRELCPVDSNGQIDEYKLKEWMNSTDRQACSLEPKYDGSRYLLHLHRKKNHLTSRRKSVKTGHYSDRIKNVPHLKKLKVSKALEATVLDGEVVSTSKKLAGEGGVAGILNSKPKRARKLQKKYGLLVYYAFGIKRFKGKNVSKKPFSVRRRLLEDALIQLKLKNPDLDKYIKIVPQIKPNSYQDVLVAYKTALQEGLEGIMIKDNREPEGKGMWKMKVYRDGSVIITGFKEGTGKYKKWFGSLICSVYDGNKELIEVAKVSGMTDELREWINRRRNKLIKKQQVIDIEGQEMTEGENPRVRHPRFLRLRDMKNYPPEKCTLARLKRDLAII